MAERAAEAVAGAEAVDHLDQVRGDDHVLVGRLAEHAPGPLLDDRDLHAGLEQRVGRPLGLGLADGDLALLLVADGDGGVLERLAVLLAGLLDRGPEHGPVVEVEDGVPGAGAAGAAAGLEGREVGGAAGLLGQARAGEPEQRHLADRVEVEVLGGDLQIGSAGLAVEVQREVVRREDLAQRDRGVQLRVPHDEAARDAEALHLLDHVAAEGIVPHAGDHGRGVPEPCGGDGDVRRAAAEELPEAVDVLEPLLDLQGVDVHAAAAERDDVEIRCHGCPCLPASEPGADVAGCTAARPSGCPHDHMGDALCPYKSACLSGGADGAG